VYISKCKLCGKEKGYKYKSQIKTYCSHACSNLDKWNKRKRAENISISCSTCGKIFYLTEAQLRVREKTSYPKYCSRKCMGVGARKRKNVLCEYCGKEFETTRGRFCSKKCVYLNKIRTGICKRNGFWYENGYRVLYNGKKNGIKEHIDIMQKYLNRVLTENEVVHHINGIKHDNRFENLQLMTKGEHSSFHRKKEKSEGKQLFGGHNGN
jgi:endogenous inhibitor of DNA gyrase (YacG/DUF329 family)